MQIKCCTDYGYLLHSGSRSETCPASCNLRNLIAGKNRGNSTRCCSVADSHFTCGNQITTVPVSSLCHLNPAGERLPQLILAHCCFVHHISGATTNLAYYQSWNFFKI